MIRKNGPRGLEVVEVADRHHRASSTAPVESVRRAKSAKRVGAVPVAFSTSLLGRDPRPDAMVSLSMRRAAPELAIAPSFNSQNRRADNLPDERDVDTAGCLLVYLEDLVDDAALSVMQRTRGRLRVSG
jgi:hypothetical protein